jgi:hypothetical protein
VCYKGVIRGVTGTVETEAQIILSQIIIVTIRTTPGPTDTIWCYKDVTKPDTGSFNRVEIESNGAELKL